MPPRAGKRTQRAPGVTSSLSSVTKPARAGSVSSAVERPVTGLLFTRVSMVLAWALLLFGLFTAVWTARIVYRTFSPVLFWDQWAIVNDLMQSQGHPSIAQLWAQHNEHRIPFGRLAGYADLELFGGRNVSLLSEIYVVQLLESLLLIWVFRRYSGLGRTEVLTAAGFFIFCAFYPIQIENFYWGFQIAFVLAPFSASLALAACVVHTDLLERGSQHSWFSLALLLSLGAALVAELNLAGGVLVWPLLLLLGFVLRMPRRTLYLIASVGVCAVAAFLWGFHSPAQVANPLQSLHHPIAAYRYARTYLAWTWDPMVPTASFWPSLVESYATLAMGVALIALVKLIKRRSGRDKLQTFFLMNMAFVLMVSVVTALGRLNFGVGQATAGRYQSIALVFWASLAGLVLIWRARSHGSPARLIEIQVVLLILVLAGGARFRASENVAKAHERALARAYGELLQDPSSSNARSQLSPYPNLAEAYQYVRAHHWGPDIEELGIVPGSMAPISHAESTQLRVAGFQVVPSTQCAGYLDLVDALPGKPGLVTAEGWAWNYASANRPSAIILALQDGTVTGRAPVTLPRPDVRHALPQITDLETGWRAEARLPPNATLRAFVVLDDAKSVCPLTNEFKRP
jgi:hypothetical protein